MTIEEEEGEQVMDMKSSEFNVEESRLELPPNKDAINISKGGSVKSRMEAMQKRIDELKEKVKYEGELLYNSKDPVSDQDTIDSKSSDSLSDNKSKYSISQESNHFEDKIRENEEYSDKSLYFSASSYSMCSVNSNSSDSTYCSFSKFVNNFMKNQDHKERLNLLQLRSNKQISLNMMKTSLSEVDSRCSEELEVIERSLKHLKKLAEQLNVDIERPKGDTSSFSLRSTDRNGSGDSGTWQPINKASFSRLTVRDTLKTKLELANDPAYVEYDLKDGSCDLAL